MSSKGGALALLAGSRRRRRKQLIPKWFFLITTYKTIVWFTGRPSMEIPKPFTPRGIRFGWVHGHYRCLAALVSFLVLLAVAGDPLPAALGTAVVMAAVHFFVPRARRPAGTSRTEANKQMNAVRNQWAMACKEAGLSAVPQLRGLKIMEGGVTATVVPASVGVDVAKLTSRASVLASVIQCQDVGVKITSPGEATLSFYFADPVGRFLPLVDLPYAPKGRLAYGIRPDGSAATIAADKSCLIGGLTGHGKSMIVWDLLGDAVRQGLHLRLYVSDPKGGMELQKLGQQLAKDKTVKGTLVVREYATDPKSTTEMIKNTASAMRCRQGDMAKRGLTKHVPSEDEPLCVLILDELLPLTDMLKKGSDSPLGEIAYIGRAVGFVVWANAQVGQVDVLGRVRDLFPQRVCVATPNRAVTESVLGDGAEAAGARCSDIGQPGVGYSFEEGSRAPVMFRAAMVEDHEAELIAIGQVPQGMRRADGGQETALYRWWDAADTLLYVGITNHIGRRTNQHGDEKPWMRDAVRSTVQWYPSREDAAKAEIIAINTEGPLHNEQHNTRRRALRRKVAA